MGRMGLRQPDKNNLPRIAVFGYPSGMLNGFNTQGPMEGKEYAGGSDRTVDCHHQGSGEAIDGNSAAGVSDEVTLDYCCGSPRRSEIVFGWGRETVCTGLGELRSGIKCRGNFSARGRHRTEEVLPHLEEDLRSLVDPQSQVDPKFQSPFAYTRMTAKAVRQALIDHKEYTSEELPDKGPFAGS